MRLAINPTIKNRIMGPVAPSSSAWLVASFPEEGVIGS
jgi:hypothetical protein